MRKADIFIALLLMSVGILVLVDSVRLGFKWGMSGPESGFFPFYLGSGLIICSLTVLFNVMRKYRKGGGEERLMPEGALKPILWVLIPATVMIAVTGLVGLHVAAALYLAFYMRAVGKIGWVTTILISLIVPISLYIAFDKLFLVPLPQGLWGAKLIPF
ncbi:MAG: tripartite tricarboxylate transporter TctB family protein [Nitrospirae bacterium]|nr:tripartite tricarboxylate transporter TctB family protein [Nitrospirota bacterium]MCL5422898.1 tripartite tricarboxylate transporter TctB family protein [Nitrospirota bacterium]